jgi:hypothetical protein
MIKQVLKSCIPHAIAVFIFLSISFVYYLSAYEGKVIQQSDVRNFEGMSKEINDFRKATGEEALWTNSMFGGMPAFQISTLYKTNLMQHIHNFLMIGKTPANFLFLTLIGFYIILLAFGANAWLSVIGAIAFAFSSYFFIIMAVGHNSKMVAIAYMAPVLAGVFYAYRKNLLLGTAIFGLFLSLELYANHLQITYYLFLIIFIFGLFELYLSFVNKTIKQFVLVTASLAIIAIVAAGSDFSRLYTTYEYSDYTTRGKSELTHNINNKTTGLDKDYATSWSYGKAETFNLLIPNFMGGSSSGPLDEKSNTYKFLSENNVPNAGDIVKNLPLYWGPQPFTEGPVYIGAIVVFLFVLGLFLIKGPIKWWLLSATILSILLAWGRNFMFFTDFFLDFVPGYNKFRTVSMILVIAELTMPLLAILAIKEIIDDKISKENFLKGIKWSAGIVGGICLLFAIFPGMFFDFSSSVDGQLKASGWPQQLIDALRNDRQSLLQADAFRSFVFIVLALGSILLMYFKKLPLKAFYVVLALLILADLWTVNKRYLNSDNFVSKVEAKDPYSPTQADLQILQDKDPNFRVLNVAANTFNDASTSYFHKSIGGYHGAKLKRYQELIEFQISKNNMAVLNMLNTKYIIVPGKERGPVAQYNSEALGNAWFVDSINVVPNADAEMEALSNFNPKTTVVVDKRYEKQLEGISLIKDTASTIVLKSYKPNKLTYESNSSNTGVVVFSEIYYDKGWNAYIDEKPAPYFRSNYVLRAMVVPQGKHTIEFRFEPKSYYMGNKVSLACSSILILLIIAAVGMGVRKEYKS